MDKSINNMVSVMYNEMKSPELQNCILHGFKKQFICQACISYNIRTYCQQCFDHHTCLNKFKGNFLKQINKYKQQIMKYLCQISTIYSKNNDIMFQQIKVRYKSDEFNHSSTNFKQISLNSLKNYLLIKIEEIYKSYVNLIQEQISKIKNINSQIYSKLQNNILEMLKKTKQSETTYENMITYRKQFKQYISLEKDLLLEKLHQQKNKISNIIQSQFSLKLYRKIETFIHSTLIIEDKLQNNNNINQIENQNNIQDIKQLSDLKESYIPIQEHNRQIKSFKGQKIISLESIIQKNNKIINKYEQRIRDLQFIISIEQEKNKKLEKQVLEQQKKYRKNKQGIEIELINEVNNNNNHQGIKAQALNLQSLGFKLLKQSKSDKDLLNYCKTDRVYQKKLN